MKRIIGCKLILGGLKGVVISHTERRDMGDGIVSPVEVTSKFKRPLSNKYRKHFLGLVPFMSDILGLEKGSEVRIGEISMDKEGIIQIHGKVRSPRVDRMYEIKTPIITVNDGYSDYETLRSSIKELFDDIEGYVANDEKLNLAQMAIEYEDQTGKLLGEKPASEMSEAERIEVYQKHLEKAGHMVMLNNGEVEPEWNGENDNTDEVFNIVESTDEALSGLNKTQ